MLLINSLSYSLTGGQKKMVEEIEKDLQSSQRMFRILQGDVGSGKTIVAIIAALNVIESGYQCGLMAPTAILAEQHFILLKKLIRKTNLDINFSLLTGKTDMKERKKILENLKSLKNKSLAPRKGGIFLSTAVDILIFNPNPRERVFLFLVFLFLVFLFWFFWSPVSSPVLSPVSSPVRVTSFSSHATASVLVS